MKKNVSFLFMMFVASEALAGTQLSEQTIEEISTGWAGEAIYVRTVEGIIGEGCTQAVYAMKPENSSLFDQNLSILLSAFHAGSKVRLYVDGCDANGRMILKAVNARK